MSADCTTTEYLLGHSSTEMQRLMMSAEVLRPLTTRLFQDAGISEGMRVLELGCGVGDVCFLAAKMVGPTGSVLGIDRAAQAVATATGRAKEMGIANVRFENVLMESMEDAPTFDAVIGRLILHHLPDPVAAVRKAAAQVHSGGLVVFHDLDLSLRVIGSWPVVPLYEKARQWTIEAQGRGGLHIEIGKQLYHVFKAAGLPGAQMRLERAIGACPHSQMAFLLSEMVRTLYDQILQLGIATEAEVQLDTLAERLEADLVAADAIMIGKPMVGAWAHKP